MKTTLLTGLALAASVSAAALAQANPAATTATKANAATPMAAQSSADASATAQGAAARGQNIRRQLVNNLKDEGFTDVKIAPESFIVEAKDKSGNPVTMFLSPNSVTEISAVDMNAQNKMDAQNGANQKVASQNAGGQNAMNARDPSGATGGQFANVTPREDLTSKLIGLAVYNQDHKDIGTIKDVAFDSSGVKAYIVAVGGFLGMGDHYVAVRPSAINLSYNTSNKKWRAEMNTDAAQLKAAPEYKYSNS
jgi:hypothetical protein